MKKRDYILNCLLNDTIYMSLCERTVEKLEDNDYIVTSPTVQKDIENLERLANIRIEHIEEKCQNFFKQNMIN